MSRSNTQPAPATPRTSIRCAVYCRKSSDEGLEQAFNSLHAQRESAEAYIASMRHEGWRLNPEHYDDGGYTGGNMERPGVQRLVADIQAGRIDCVVVYKVDRLSRSLMDFARMMETFEKHGVCFVSVTQQFNTTSSMGRLTLNILLSFAQFERELVSERTRDKIAAARRKGKWAGGRPILGYDIEPGTRRLLVNPAEAEQVREVFRMYLQERSLVRTARRLNERGWTTKKATTIKGGRWGGRPWDKVNLHLVLNNVMYLGKIRHKENVYPGEQPAIVAPETWEQVQATLKSNGVGGGMHCRNKHGALLKGLLFCKPCGSAMVHAYTIKSKARRYRYYVCGVAQKRGRDACPTRSIPADQIESLILGQIRRLGTDPELLSRTLEHARRLAGEDGHDKETICKEAVDTALGEFERLWACLSPAEQARLVRLVVRRVDYDPQAGNVAVGLHPLGLARLHEIARPTETTTHA
jgi:site-specific DNA recombinase